MIVLKNTFLVVGWILVILFSVFLAFVPSDGGAAFRPLANGLGFDNEYNFIAAVFVGAVLSLLVSTSFESKDKNNKA